MSFNETISFETGYRALLKEAESGSTQPHPNPTSLPLDEIKMAHSVFQPRGFDDVAASEEHIRSLVTAIQNEPSGKLDPILIWWSGKYWRVIDGHHRVLAYNRPRNNAQPVKMIPVKVFIGTLNEALLASIDSNSKDKLAMHHDDKLNRAWILTIVHPDISKSEVSKICKVGTATVARMRKCLQRFKDQDPDGWYSECLSMSWKEAMNHDRPVRKIDEDWEDKLARDWSKRLAKTFGKKLSNQSSVAAKAIEHYSAKLACDLGSAFRHHVDGSEDYF